MVECFSFQEDTLDFPQSMKQSAVHKTEENIPAGRKEHIRHLDWTSSGVTSGIIK